MAVITSQDWAMGRGQVASDSRLSVTCMSKSRIIKVYPYLLVLVVVHLVCPMTVMPVMGFAFLLLVHHAVLTHCTVPVYMYYY